MDQQSEFSVIFYEKEDGSMPARDFLLGLDENLKAKLYATLICWLKLDLHLESRNHRLKMMESLKFVLKLERI